MRKSKISWDAINLLKPFLQTDASMGNSLATSLRQAVSSGNMVELQDISLNNRDVGATKLNSSGDNVLIYATRVGNVEVVRYLCEEGLCEVNATNDKKQTALDVVLYAILPQDVLSRYHKEPPSAEHDDNQTFVLPELLSFLLSQGGVGESLLKLVLHVMDDNGVLKSIVDLIPDLTAQNISKVIALIMRVSSVYQHFDVIEQLFLRGVAVHTMWMFPFMPKFHRPLDGRWEQPWPIEDEAEYCLPEVNETEWHLNDKLSLLSIWRGEWNDGENPTAQFKAGPVLDPNMALLFLRASNEYKLLNFIMKDVLSYLPVSCEGPDLKSHTLLQSFINAGYIFSNDQMQHFELKFGFDFGQFKSKKKTADSLKNICRVKIRFCFKFNVLYSVSHIEIPYDLKEFLTLR